MNCIAKLKTLFSLLFTRKPSSKEDVADTMFGAGILEVQINSVTAGWITDLGVEGIFKPLIQSSPAAEFMIIDLSLLRDLKCDINYGELSLLITSNSDVTAEQLNANSYIFLAWEV